MIEQTTGVLREVLSVADGRPRPAFSRLFSPELHAIGADLTPISGERVRVSLPPAAEVIAGLPAPLADGADPAAGYLATLGPLPPEQQAAALLAAVSAGNIIGSTETKLALARALITAGDPDGAAAYLAELAAADPGDWRIAWHNGLRELSRGRPEAARAAFSAVYAELPGELAPKLALAFAAEALADEVAARHYYRLVWTIDRSYVSAAFGAARTCLALGERPAAIAAVAAVPDTSSYHAAAQIAAVRLLIAGGTGVSASDVRQADGRLVRLSLDELRRQQLTVEILHAALGAASDGGGAILGCEPNERSLRLGLERGYRALAGLTQDPSRRVELVDQANAVRPRTLT
jgi:serine/threonine-protein kinase PknG